ncbi:hypothetical protein CVT25_009250 [Psilocybe cyanescens]|uniref:Uncharacterized protein n=1 Tax=Psilocybe cyanescens TaxID=93625 RepID=A0A409XTE7_PSICY|nr:hypothetical protein CVT25_009250 [Psilocybe cyanescens]
MSFCPRYLAATARSDLTGPVDGANYTYLDVFDLVSTVTSPCGVSSVLNIQSDLRVSNSKNAKGSRNIATHSAVTQGLGAQHTGDKTSDLTQSFQNEWTSLSAAWT